MQERGIGAEVGLSPLAQPLAPAQSKYERLIQKAKGVPAATTIVVHPCDESSLRGVVEAAEAGIIIPTLVGPAAKITTVAREKKLDISRFALVDAAHSDDAAARGVALIRESKGELLMKGSLHTDELMRQVTSGTTGLRTGRRISHVFIMDVPTYAETLFITDAAINIFPDLDTKRDIIQNVIDLFTQVGLGTPRVAILSAVETVTSKIPSTIEAAALCKMADRGQITGGILDGPLAFDNAIPFVDHFAIPERFYVEGVRRYGFHGLSYEFIAERLQAIAPDIARKRVIVAHLGSGASMCALSNGRSIESTMGFTALDGLPMGTRPGQIDPGVLLYLIQQKGLDAAAVQDLLYRDSGLKGISGVSNDMRELQASTSPKAALAIDYFVYRVGLHSGLLAAALHGLDAFVFTAGVGENSAAIRARIAEKLGWLGAELDGEANAASKWLISTPKSRVALYVVPTDEELMIARHTLAVISERAAERAVGERTPQWDDASGMKK